MLQSPTPSGGTDNESPIRLSLAAHGLLFLLRELDHGQGLSLDEVLALTTADQKQVESVLHELAYHNLVAEA